jgi:hypothetical protein
VKEFLRRYQIIIFFALTFIISWYPWHSGGAGFFAWGPSAAGLIVTAVVAGRKGIVLMLRRLIRWRARFRYWAVALFGLFVILLTAIGSNVLLGGEMPPLLLDVSATLLLDIALSGMMSGEVVPTPDFGILWTQVVVAVFVALIFVIATKGRLGFVAKEQTKSERSASLITNP